MKIKRTYELSPDLHRWLEAKARTEGRAVIRQVEKIIEEARARDQADQKALV